MSDYLKKIPRPERPELIVLTGEARPPRPLGRWLLLAWLAVVGLLIANLISGCGASTYRIPRGPIVHTHRDSPTWVMRDILALEAIYAEDKSPIDPSIWEGLVVYEVLARLPCPTQIEPDTPSDGPIGLTPIRYCNGYVYPDLRQIYVRKGSDSLIHELIHYVQYTRGEYTYDDHPPSHYYRPGSIEARAKARRNAPRP